MASFEDSAMLLPLRAGAEPVIPSLVPNNLITICENKVAFAFDRFIYIADTLDKKSPLQVVPISCSDTVFGLHRLVTPQRGAGSNEFVVALGAAWIQVIETEEMQNAFMYKIPAANPRPGLVHFAQSMCLLTPGAAITKHRLRLPAPPARAPLPDPQLQNDCRNERWQPRHFSGRGLQVRSQRHPEAAVSPRVGVAHVRRVALRLPVRAPPPPSSLPRSIFVTLCAGTQARLMAMLFSTRTIRIAN
jgi:hypothetical protein